MNKFCFALLSLFVLIIFTKQKNEENGLDSPLDLSKANNMKSISLLCRKFSLTGHCGYLFNVPTYKEEQKLQKLHKKLKTDLKSYFDDFVSDHFLSSSISKKRRKNKKIVNTLSDDKGKVIDEREMWEKYRSALIAFIKKNTYKDNSFSGLQLTDSNFDADWDEEPENLQRILKYSNQWKEIFQPNNLKNGKFTENYKNFLMDLKTQELSKEIENKLQPLYEKISKIQDDLIKEDAKCNEKWEKLSSPLKEMYKEYKGFKLKRCYNLASLEEENQETRGRIQAIYRQTGNWKDYLAKNSFKKMYLVPENQRKWTEVTQLKDFMRRCKNGQYSNFEIKVSQKTSYFFESAYQKSTGVFAFVFSYNSGKMKYKLTTRSNEFEMKFGAKSYTAIHVTPKPNWFTWDVLNDWKNGPFKSKNKWFGKGGKLAIIPKTLFVLYQPNIELIVNKHDADEFKKSSYKSFGLSLGFFNFNMGKAKTTVKKREKDNLYKIVISGNSDTPQVFAVDNVIV